MIRPTWLPGFLLITFIGTAQDRAERYGIFEASYQGTGRYSNPYVEVSAEAAIVRPGGERLSIPLFWDGASQWRLRLSPDLAGKWTYTVKSNDPGLNGKTGGFLCVDSKRTGGLQPIPSAPSHFQRQSGAPVWFMADTAWGYLTDSETDNHHRPQAQHYAKTRASQGFNAIHSMMLSEQGVGNQNGKPFDDMAAQKMNPGYWQEVDDRLAFANRLGLTVGLAIAWGDKRKVEPFAWRMFPNLDARKRYARYIAARYSGYNVYFIVSGERHAEVRNRSGVTEDEIFREFVQIGSELAASDPHDRMIAIHPMTQNGSVREFAVASWMSFGDYQQNYRDLHDRVLLSRYLRGPVVNAEYGYHLRDQDGDGKPDKSNSYATEDMRFASWDIVTAGGYLVTGFGTTYFGGHRDPGPFDVDATKNDEWEAQIGYIKKFFEQLTWWKLIPADQLLSAPVERSKDRTDGGVRPPVTTYWAMATPGETYLAYVRGMTAPIELELGSRPRRFAIREFNPRTGQFRKVGEHDVSGKYTYRAPDANDWVVLLEAGAGRTPPARIGAP